MADAPSLMCSENVAAARPASQSYICDANSEHTFCAPYEKSGDFYVAIPDNPEFPIHTDMPRIGRWLKNQTQRPMPVPAAPELVLESRARLYKVTNMLPKTVAERTGKPKGVHGPNCYMTALSTVSDRNKRYERVRDRHVSTSEMDYYLKRDFMPVSCANPGTLGGIVIYDAYFTPFDSGSHAAYKLSGEMVFHNGGWRASYPFEAVCINQAMGELVKHWQKGPNETYEDRPQINDLNFQHSCYEEKNVHRPSPKNAEPKDRVWHKRLFEYYNQRMRKISKVPCSRLSDERMQLLTVENMWKALGSFRKRLGAGPTEALQKLDDDIAEDYLELESLDWQYQAAIGMCAPKSRSQPTNEYLLDLYKKHYIKFGGDFDEECNFYLELWKVPQQFKAQITAQFAKLIGEYDVTKFARSDGGEGIPYLAVLTKAILSALPSWRPPADTEIVQPLPLTATGAALPERRKFTDRNVDEFCKVRHGEVSDDEQCKRK